MQAEPCLEEVLSCPKLENETISSTNIFFHHFLETKRDLKITKSLRCAALLRGFVRENETITEFEASVARNRPGYSVLALPTPLVT